MQKINKLGLKYIFKSIIYSLLYFIFCFTLLMLIYPIVNYYIKQKNIENYFLDCQKSNNIYILQNCMEKLYVNSEGFSIKLFINKYDIFYSNLFRNDLNKEQKFIRLNMIKNLYEPSKDDFYKYKKYLKKCIDIDVYGFCFTKYLEIITEEKSEKEAELIKNQIVHEKKFMEQVSQNCLRNVFYDIYIQENKEEYNQIFKQCGWKFGKEKLKLNQDIKNQFNLKMKPLNK